jgi:hypothetical protein
MSPGRTSPAHYRVVVRGEIGDQFAVLFDGMRIEHGEGTTVLSGSVRDQSHLAGILERAQELGLDIVSLSEVEEPEPH